MLAGPDLEVIPVTLRDCAGDPVGTHPLIRRRVRDTTGRTSERDDIWNSAGQHGHRRQISAAAPLNTGDIEPSCYETGGEVGGVDGEGLVP